MPSTGILWTDIVDFIEAERTAALYEWPPGGSEPRLYQPPAGGQACGCDDETAEGGPADDSGERPAA